VVQSYEVEVVVLIYMEIRGMETIVFSLDSSIEIE